MEEFHIQVENKRRHPMLASPPPTPPAGNSQVKHTDMYYTGSFSRYTLYTSLGKRKEEIGCCDFLLLLLLFKEQFTESFESIHNETEHSRYTTPGCSFFP